jgi:ribosomal-protein-alanine N-acetyltransferase
MNIELIEVNLNQVNDYFELFSSENVCKYFDIIPHKSIENTLAFITNAIKLVNEQKVFRYSIKQNRKIVGSISLYSISNHQQRASIGYALNEKYWGKGIMKQAIQQVEELSSKNYNIHRIQATILTQNVQSKKLLQKCNYEYEGLIKQYEIWEGKGFVDLEMYSKIL